MQNNTDVCSTTLPIMPVRRFKAELGISKIAEPEKGKTKFNGWALVSVTWTVSFIPQTDVIHAHLVAISTR
jgi:hypothetical protein